jgi:hypothetical protein
MIRSDIFTLPGEKQKRYFKWSFYFLGILFFLNCFTPLRLHYDMLRYFAIKDCIESHCPPGADPKDYMPYGYTALLLFLSRLGILKSFYLVFINCIYLFGGLYFVRKIFSTIREPFFLFFLVLMNWTIIKFVAHPLSEMQYLFFSSGSVYSFCLFSERKNFWHLVLAFFLAGMAFLTRTVGISLVVALFTAIIWEYRKQVILLIKKNRMAMLGIGACVAGVLVFSRQLGLNHYTGVMSNQFKGGVRFVEVIQWHFAEWGEILMNTSRLKVITHLPAGLGEVLFVAIGVLGICGFVYICFIRKNRIPFVVKAYLFFYMILLFNWPFPDPRFWVPIIPLIAAVISQTSISSYRLVKLPAFIYFITYTLLGLLSLGFFTYTSFNKEEFSKTQAKGVYRNEYEVHFFGKTLSDTATHTDPNLVEFLNKYDGYSFRPK